MGNVIDHSLLVAPAERADVIVDFSAYEGQTLILYNDAPVAFPALDPRQDYYTGMEDMRDTGSHWPTLPGLGPNTRTIMQIVVNPAAVPPVPDTWVGQAALQTEWASVTGHPGVFERAQDPILVGQTAYDSAYTRTGLPVGRPETFPASAPYWGYANIHSNALRFETLTGLRLVIPMERKALHDEMGGVYDQWGRMSGKLGMEVPGTNALTQAFSPLAYVDPSTEILKNNLTPLTPVLGDGTQIWKFTHNGVDTHPLHFHLMNVQLINRAGWDGAIRLPDANELGWKETIRVSPLEDTVFAMRPYAPNIPFKIGDSVRMLDPTMPEGATWQSWDPVTGDGPLIISNAPYNYGWEYMLHCHVLSHEEMEMMRPLDFLVSPAAPSALAATAGAFVALTWTNNATTPAATNLLVRRATDSLFTQGVTTLGMANPLATAYSDMTVDPGTTYYYQIRAENSISYSAWSETASITTPGQADLPPDAPTNLTATATAPQQVDLAWADNSIDETSFEIQRSVGAGAFAALTTVGADIATYSDTTALPSTSYTYRVRAINTAGNSAWSNTASATTPSLLPTAPINLSATLSAQAPLTVGLAWTDTASNETGFTIERATNTGFTTGRVTFTVGANVTAYADTTAAVSATYYYRVRASNVAGVSAWSNTASIAVVPPAAPTSFTATASPVSANPPTVALAWRDNSANEGGFQIQRATNASFTVNLTTVAVAANVTGYVDSAVQSNIRYYYRVRAVNGAGNSAWSASMSATTAGILPAAPTNLTGTATQVRLTDQVTLRWQDNSNNETSFTIQRSTSTAFASVVTATAAANATSYVQQSVPRRTTFYYRIRANNAYGSSTWSNVLQIVTP